MTCFWLFWCHCFLSVLCPSLGVVSYPLLFSNQSRQVFWEFICNIIQWSWAEGCFYKRQRHCGMELGVSGTDSTSPPKPITPPGRWQPVSVSRIPGRESILSLSSRAVFSAGDPFFLSPTARHGIHRSEIPLQEHANYSSSQTSFPIE